jgi:hypothetical protein
MTFGRARQDAAVDVGRGALRQGVGRVAGLTMVATQVVRIIEFHIGSAGGRSSAPPGR